MRKRRPSQRVAVDPWMRWVIPAVLVVLLLGLFGVLVLTFWP